MSKAVDYLDVDQYGPYTVRCMNGCGYIIARRKIVKTKTGERSILIHNIMSRRYPVQIEDGSKANILICKRCLEAGNIDLKKFELTMHKGWEKTQDAVYKGKADYSKAMQRVQDLKLTKKIKR